MHSLCGKHVNSLGIDAGKTSGSRSTSTHEVRVKDTEDRAKPTLLHKFSQLFAQPFPTVNIAPLPLVEHNFYPLSTAPITTTIKRKFKER